MGLRLDGGRGEVDDEPEGGLPGAALGGRAGGGADRAVTFLVLESAIDNAEFRVEFGKIRSGALALNNLKL